MYADNNNAHSYFTKVGTKELEDLMEAVMNNTADINEIDKLTFNTINWINENTSWEGGRYKTITKLSLQQHIPYQMKVVQIILLMVLIHRIQIL